MKAESHSETIKATIVWQQHVKPFSLAMNEHVTREELLEIVFSMLSA
jgi:hypothetical protein